jgi:hypothetical protein
MKDHHNQAKYLFRNVRKNIYHTPKSLTSTDDMMIYVIT